MKLTDSDMPGNLNPAGCPAISEFARLNIYFRQNKTSR